MTDEERLSALKTMLEENDPESRMLTDERLSQLIAEADGDLRRAAYNGALLKARCTALTLPDGVSVESMRDYWLTVARGYRGSCTVTPDRG